jgi:hypothetical protein
LLNVTAAVRADRDRDVALALALDPRRLVLSVCEQSRAEKLLQAASAPHPSC